MFKPTDTPEFPSISPQLIEALDRIFPDALSNLSADYDLREVDHAVGARAVIMRLKLEMNRQTGKR